MSFRDMNIDIQYRSGENNFAKDFLIPVIAQAKQYKRAVGYFSTTTLVDLSVGLFEMAKRGGKIKIVCSPKLSDDDLEAINLGYKVREKVFERALDISLTAPIDEFEMERLNLIATLVATGALEFQLAFMETSNGINIYHEKIAILYDEEGNRISFTGSLNDSKNAYDDNFESIFVFCDWNSGQREYVTKVETDFDCLWNDCTNTVKVIPFPEIIVEKLKTFRKQDVTYETDYRQFVVSKHQKAGMLQMPKDVELKDYQNEAIEQWKKHGYRGIYDMATGTGKTFTALGSIERLSDTLEKKLAVFVVCPYIHLVGQWEEDIVAWGMTPIIAHSQSTTINWKEKIVSAYKSFRSKGKPFICITTNDTYCGDTIQSIVNNISPDMNFLLVVDEAHNFGAKKQSTYMNKNIKYRLALSATIERYMDQEGTERIFDFFGERCITYSLEQAIKEEHLVEYEYYPIYSFLSSIEFQKYRKLTKQIRKCINYEDGKSQISEAGKILLFKRTRILAGAECKISILKELLRDYQKEKYMLVYCGATSVELDDMQEDEKQITYITKMMENELEIKTHKFTAEENLKQRNIIKECFADGIYQAITAIRCLDEGVNIPDIRTAFILSSSRNPKEFIQRRGRLLRTAKGKKKAVIYDFVTLPRQFEDIAYGDYEEDKSIVIGELVRINEFGRLALNRLEADRVMDEIQNAYGVTIDIEEEINHMEDEEYE